MDHRPKWKTQNFKLLEDKIRENLGDVGFGDDFKSSKAWSMILKNKQRHQWLYSVMRQIPQNYPKQVTKQGNK